MKTENEVTMHGDLDRIVALAGDVQRWPVILPHYRWVTLIDGGGDHKTVEMAARKGRFPVKWRAIQTIERDGPTPIIRYRHIGGVTKGMDVAWTFDVEPGAVIVRIDHEFAPPWPIVGGVIANKIIGPHFVASIAGKTLQTIKGIVENRDPRFDVDGKARS
jgi:uncharacterized membrane protein